MGGGSNSGGGPTNNNGNLPCPVGFIRNDKGKCVTIEEYEKPCAGDLLINMEITNYNQGKDSNRFGCVRIQDSKVCNNKVGIRMHAGIDLVAPIGTNVFSIISGTVHETRNENESNGYGNHIIIESNGFYYMFAHLNSEPEYNVGDYISKGQIIGESGDSDTTNEPHLHIEAREISGGFYSSTPVNIENILTTKFDNNNNSINDEDC